MARRNARMLRMSSIVVSEDEPIDLHLLYLPLASPLAANTTAAEHFTSSSPSSNITITSTTTTTTSILTTVAVAAIANETNTNASAIGEEVERADIPAETTEAAEPTLPAIIAIDRTTEETGVLFIRDRACLACSALPQLITHLLFLF